MTEYKCRRGFKHEIPDNITNEPRIKILEPDVRAYCAFCDDYSQFACSFNDDTKTLEYRGKICVWVRSDLDYHEWENQEEWEE